MLRTVLFNWMILLTIGCVIALLSERLARMYAAVLFGLGMLLWGQGNLWNADYGVLAGRDVDLSAHAWRAGYELAAWGIGLLLALAFFRPISRIAPFATIVFMCVQAAAVLFDAGPATAQRPRWIEPPPAIYQFSASQNVLHIVLDEFQSDVFTEILQQDRATLDRQFSGFQYFVDHAGAFPTTSFSMPAMLTGREYRNEKPAPEFVREAFKEASVFDKVSKAGYDVDALSIVPIASFEEWLGPEATPNWKGARFRIRKPFVSQQDYREVSARQLFELSLFRHVPHSLKETIVRRPEMLHRTLWMDRRESPAQVRRHEAANSVAFLEHYTNAMSVGRERPVYKLLHVGVPHRPIVVDRECRFIGLTDMSRESYTAQSRCAIKLVAVAPRSRAGPRHLRQQPDHRLVGSRYGSAASRVQRQQRKPVAVAGPFNGAAARDCRNGKSGDADQAATAHRPDHDLGSADVACRFAIDHSRHPRSSRRVGGRADVSARCRHSLARARSACTTLIVRFPKAYLDRIDVLPSTVTWSMPRRGTYSE